MYRVANIHLELIIRALFWQHMIIYTVTCFHKTYRIWINSGISGYFSKGQNTLIYSPWNVLLSHFCVRSPFAHCPFTVRSACAYRAFIVHSFAFSLHCSLAFTVHKAFSVRSPFVHLSFTKHSSFIQRSVFIVIRNSEVERSISRSWNEVMIKR